MKSFIISCEHSSNHIPYEFRDCFADAASDLVSHKGLDMGAGDLACFLAEKLKTPSVIAENSRLLIDLNRSVNNPALFSKYTAKLDQETKDNIYKKYYLPYRIHLENLIKKELKKNTELFHISVHSFTPVMNQKERKMDVGLLYDPSRLNESNFCKKWKENLQALNPDFKIYMNQPYRGTSDGITVYFRKKYKVYSGIELEVNQKLLNKKSAFSDSIKNILYRSIH